MIVSRQSKKKLDYKKVTKIYLEDFANVTKS